jgi:hypothetical protein
MTPTDKPDATKDPAAIRELVEVAKKSLQDIAQLASQVIDFCDPEKLGDDCNDPCFKVGYAHAAAEKTKEIASSLAAAEAAKVEATRAERERIVDRLISLRETFLCCDGPVEAKGVSASIAVIIEAFGVKAEVGT